MGPGGIATIIAAASLFVIAVAIAYAVVRLGRLIDEAKANIQQWNDFETTEHKKFTQKIKDTIAKFEKDRDQ